MPSHVKAFKCLIFSQGDHGDVGDLIPENEEHELKSEYEVCHFAWCLIHPTEKGVHSELPWEN